MKACINLDFPSDTMPTRKAVATAVAAYGLKVESFIARGPAGGNPNADLIGDDSRIRKFLEAFSADPAHDATRIVSNEFSYDPWRHGGWYVGGAGMRYPNGGCGCVSRNYADGKWRIACDPRPFAEQPTFPNRDAAARAERELIAQLVKAAA